MVSDLILVEEGNVKDKHTEESEEMATGAWQQAKFGGRFFPSTGRS